MNISSLTPNKQVKLQYWLDVIRQCRASGLTNRQNLGQIHSQLEIFFEERLTEL